MVHGGMMVHSGVQWCTVIHGGRMVPVARDCVIVQWCAVVAARRLLHVCTKRYVIYRDCRKGSRRRHAASPRKRWCTLEVCCRSAGEKLQAGLYTGILPADKRERWHGGWG